MRRGLLLLVVASFLAVPGVVACSDLKQAAEAAPVEAGPGDGGVGVGDETLGPIDGAKRDAPVEDADAGDPCDPDYGDAGAIDREWAMTPLAPADAPAANYAVRGGVVCDRTTRLVWERAVGPVRTWDEASTYCDTLGLGGYTDWRLPTRIELLGIVDYAATPALEATAFPAALVQAKVDGGAIETQYWASTPNPQLRLRRYVISFEVGQAYTVVKDERVASRCVRGGAPPNTTAGITYLATANTALDPRTGLRWQRGEIVESPVTWSSALQACQALTLDGVSGFRLPSMRELESLYDARSTIGPLWDRAAFSAPNPTLAAARLWSSNDIGTEALLLSFIPGESMVPFAKTSFAGARCVKGP